MRDSNFMLKAGVPLHKAGFSVLPIKPGLKRPKFYEWTKLKATDKHLEKWVRAGNLGVGVLTGNIVGIDIDIPDNKELVKEFYDFCSLIYGAAPIRRGRGTKILLVYRTDTPMKKQVSRKFEKPGLEVMRLEVLGKGQQFVVAGIHPDTKKPYRWEKTPLWELSPEDLPTLSQSDVTDVLKTFEFLAKKFGYKEARKKLSDDFDQDIDPEMAELASVREPAKLSDKLIKLAMSRLPADDYEDWLEMGMALHHQFSGDKKGLEFWIQWSQKSDEFEPGVCEEKWKTFSITHFSGRVVTFRAVLKKTGIQLHGSDPLSDALENYIYISEGDLVSDLRLLPHLGTMKLKEFANYVANVKIEVKGTTPTGRPTSSMKPLSNLWLGHGLRRTAVKVGYNPDKTKLFSDSGQSFFNLFSFPTHTPTNDTNLIAPFLAHMNYLFPIADQREWFIDWLAHAVQKPGERPQVTPLHISRLHGTGRGMIVRTMFRLFGSWNCKKTTISDLVKGNYNEYLHRSIFAFIDEAKEDGENQYTINDKVRDKLTEESLQINEKYGFKGTATIYTRIFLSSNHFDALRIPIYDRRLNVFEGPEILQDADYFNRYVEWLRDPAAVAQLFGYLKRRPLGEWNMQRCMLTAARAKMIEFGRNDTEALFFEMLENPPRPVMTYQQVIEHLESSPDVDPLGADIKTGQVTKLLQEHCEVLQRERVDGVRLRPWSLKPGTHHKREDVRRYLSKEYKKPQEKVTQIRKNT